MTTYACPRGHASETDDFCDTCGTRITGPGAGSGPVATGAGSGPVAAGPTDGAAPPTTTIGVQCPHCGTPRGDAGRFCEDCGYDYETGKVPALVPAPTLPDIGSGQAGSGPAGSGRIGAGAGAGAQWTATVTADREYFAANAIDGVEFPAHCPPRTFTLPAPQVRIGRRSASKGTDPEMDLSAPPLDPGVSHSHALLTLDTQGVWLVCDLGSTNGTYLNDEPNPLVAGQSRPLADGDRVHVGAWTTITVHAPS